MCGSVLPLLFLLILFTGCRKKGEVQEKEESIVQVSTIDALLNGVYDGTKTLNELREWGDFGIGTFHALDGEMVLLNGTFYQVKADGEIYLPSGKMKTPFAAVTRFTPEKSEHLAIRDYPRLKAVLDSLIPSPNLFYAIRFQGTFGSVTTRSVPAQQKPYLPLTEITADQPEFSATHISGTLAGFYCPPYVQGINVPGYHLHFLSEEKNFGGHLLGFEMGKGRLQLDQVSHFRMLLPEKGDFLDSDLRKDRSSELKKVEGE